MPENPISSCERVWINVRLATMDLARPGEYGALENDALGVRAGRIAAIEPMSAVALDRLAGEVIDVRGAWIAPGADQLPFASGLWREPRGGIRHAAWRHILRRDRAAGRRHPRHGPSDAGHGRRAGSAAQHARLHALAAEGVTTVEIKSGYGLTLADELKMLRVARSLADELPVRITTTLLAPRASCRRNSPAGRTITFNLVCREIIPPRRNENWPTPWTRSPSIWRSRPHSAQKSSPRPKRTVCR